MPLPPGLPVVDHHCHLSPSGAGVEAAKRFRAAGGTHLFLATQQYGPEVPLTVQEYQQQFETTERLAARVRDEASVTAYVVVAPYPVDLVRAAAVRGTTAALDVHKMALDLAGRWVRERRAVALGEVGWPHFAVPADVEAAGRSAFDHALGVAHDVGCPVVVHSNDLDEAGYGRLSDVARAAGVPAGRVVKHYARERVSPSVAHGVVPSYLARRELASEVFADDPPWFLETDFLDDPRRPGAVLDLATVPRRATGLVASSPESADRLWGPFADSVERVYGFRPRVSAEGTS